MEPGRYQRLYRRWLEATASDSEYRFCVGLQDAGNSFLFTEEACRRFLEDPPAFLRERENSLSWGSPEELDVKLAALGY